MIVTSIGIAALVLSALMAAAWFVQYKTRNSGWSDVFWSYEMGIGGVFLALVPWDGGWHGPTARQWLVAILVAIWSVRLGTHILKRTLGSSSEDPRYAEMRVQWKDSFQSRLFWFLQIRRSPPSCWCFRSASRRIIRRWASRSPTSSARSCCSVRSTARARADTELRQFAADKANKGRICEIGLWGWSRHPNYFFEWFGWLAYPVIAIDFTSHYPWGFAALSGPIFMFVLLRYVSGVPPLEEHMIRKHGGNFRAYQERVSAFFPLPPRKDPS